MLLSFLRGDQQVEVRTQLKSFRAVSFELFCTEVDWSSMLLLLRDNTDPRYLDMLCC
jgi:hypothetical protein